MKLIASPSLPTMTLGVYLGLCPAAWGWEDLCSSQGFHLVLICMCSSDECYYKKQKKTEKTHTSSWIGTFHHIVVCAAWLMEFDIPSSLAQESLTASSLLQGGHRGDLTLASVRNLAARETLSSRADPIWRLPLLLSRGPALLGSVSPSPGRRSFLGPSGHLWTPSQFHLPG